MMRLQMTEIGEIAEDTVRHTQLFLERMRDAPPNTDTSATAEALARLEKLNDEVTDILFFYARDYTRLLNKRKP